MLLDGEPDLFREDRFLFGALGLAGADFDVVGEPDEAAGDIDFLDDEARIFGAAGQLFQIVGAA
jgi:hypothetical protein